MISIILCHLFACDCSREQKKSNRLDLYEMKKKNIWNGFRHQTGQSQYQRKPFFRQKWLYCVCVCGVIWLYACLVATGAVNLCSRMLSAQFIRGIVINRLVRSYRMKCRMFFFCSYRPLATDARRIYSLWNLLGRFSLKTGRGIWIVYNCICSNGKVPFSFSVEIVCTFERLLFDFVAWLLRLFSVFKVDSVFDDVLSR